ncbi:MAG: hypothetical protein WBG50_16905 [Desulfomonilaceae bacterium]
MTTEVSFEKGIPKSMGTTVVITWVLILGPIGALLLGAVAYSMHAGNLIVGAICGALFFLPLLLTMVWGIEMWLEVRRTNRVQRRALVLTTDPIDSPTR